MAELIYSLCALTSVACAWLSLRGYQRSGHRLLFWGGLCCLGLSVNNVLLVLDKRALPHAARMGRRDRHAHTRLSYITSVLKSDCTGAAPVYTIGCCSFPRVTMAKNDIHRTLWAGRTRARRMCA